MKTTCKNPVCGREFVATSRYLELAGGLCRNCAANADSVQRTCEDCGGSFREYPRFLAGVGAFAGARKRCPACHDRKRGASGVNIAVNRECLQFFPLVRVELDMESAELCPETEISGRPSRKAVLKNQRNKSYDGSLTVYDLRPDGERGFGSMALVRVMKVTHAEGHTLTVMSGQVMGAKHEEVLEFSPEFEYLVLESVDPINLGKDPEAALLFAFWEGKHNASGGLVRNEAHWSRTLTSRSRTGMHSAGTLVALVDDEHPAFVRQDHLVHRYGLDGAELEEFGFRDDLASGAVRPRLYVPGGTVEQRDALEAAGWRAKLVGTYESGGLLVSLLGRDDGSFELPPDLTGELRLEASEAGGGYTSRGWAVVVAGLDGSAQQPFGTGGWRGPLACGTHAYFSVAGGLVTVQAGGSHGDYSVAVTRHEWQPGEDNSGRIVAERVFEGAPEALPEELAFLRAGVNAACQKAATYHCRSMVFGA